MENDPARGPEHVPLPSAARGDARAEPLSDARLPRVPNADPSPGKLLAVAGGTVAAGILAVAVAGGALWHYVAAPAPVPAAPAAVVASAPDAPPASVLPPPAADLAMPAPSRFSAAVEDRPTSPLLHGDAFGSTPEIAPETPAPETVAPAVAAKPALPEPPTSVTPSYVPDAAGAIAAQTSSLSASEISALFKHSAGNFADSNPAGRPGASGVPGACPSCDNAVNASGTARLSGGPRMTVGRVEYVGPCKDGYVYRLVNMSQLTLPNAMVADDGQVWRTGPLGPGQSVEIRSKTLIHRTTSVNLP